LIEFFVFRIDAEASELRKKLEKMNTSQIPQESEDKEVKAAPLTIEVIVQYLQILSSLHKLIWVAPCDRLSRFAGS